MSEQLVEQLAQQLINKKIMVATAESCTGGGIASAFTDLAGSSAWFDAGFVTYSNQAKMRMLNVQESTLIAHGAVSEPVVREMVMGAVRNSQAQLAVSVSGIAGPGGGSEEKPVGTVWFAWGNEDKQIAERCVFAGNRQQVREQAVRHAIQGLLNWLMAN